tara:strand:- start:726 stop:1058 length:333 start_codon:yes stop_codon:yes gene_type:complete
MGELNENEFTEIVIDLTKGKEMHEDWSAWMGYGIKNLLKRMFGGTGLPVSVKGSPSQIKNFAGTLGKEKKYMEQAMKYGLDNPRTYRSKSELDRAVRKFKRFTGMDWPMR